MIKSFKNKQTEKLFHRQRGHKFPADVADRALRKLLLVHYAESLDDLRAPPSNNLEALKGDRKGQHSIRVNKKWRVCFKWDDNHAHNVEIVDYHK